MIKPLDVHGKAFLKGIGVVPVSFLFEDHIPQNMILKMFCDSSISVKKVYKKIKRDPAGP